MKTAKYIFDGKQRKIYGTVTVKETVDGGKIIVTLSDAQSMTTAAERRAAKALGEDIARVDFNHPAVTQVTRETISALEQKLIAETTDLLETYIERTRIHANAVYMFAEERANWKKEDYMREYGTKEEATEYWSREQRRVVPGPTKTVLSDLGKCKMDLVNSTLAYTRDIYVSRAVYWARKNYEGCIKRLAAKLNKKGIKDDSGFTMASTKINDNIETIIYHDGTITRAWSIWAAAESVLVVPHFRYLVK